MLLQKLRERPRTGSYPSFWRRSLSLLKQSPPFSASSLVRDSVVVEYRPTVDVEEPCFFVDFIARVWPRVEYWSPQGLEWCSPPDVDDDVDDEEVGVIECGKHTGAVTDQARLEWVCMVSNRFLRHYSHS